MKNFFIGLIGSLILVGVIGFAGWLDNHEWRKGTVTDIENGIVYVTDDSGYVWSFYGDYQIGSRVKLQICLNHSTTMEDDIIEKVESL